MKFAVGLARVTCSVAAPDGRNTSRSSWVSARFVAIPRCRRRCRRPRTCSKSARTRPPAGVPRRSLTRVFDHDGAGPSGGAVVGEWVLRDGSGDAVRARRAGRRRCGADHARRRGPQRPADRRRFVDVAVLTAVDSVGIGALLASGKAAALATAAVVVVNPSDLLYRRLQSCLAVPSGRCCWP